MPPASVVEEQRDVAHAAVAAGPSAAIDARAVDADLAAHSAAAPRVELAGVPVVRAVDGALFARVELAVLVSALGRRRASAAGGPSRVGLDDVVEVKRSIPRALPRLFAALALLSTARVAAAQDMAPPEDANQPMLSLGGQAGFSWATGNTKSLVANGAVRGSLRSNANQLTISGVFAYSSARAVPEGEAKGAPEKRFVVDDNVYARVRYDRFFLDRNAAFFGFLAFRDPSSGFTSRFMPYAGLLRTLLEKKSVWALWGEGGYRGAVERLDLDDAAVAAGLSQLRFVHGPSAFLGYRVALSPTVSFDVGAEALADVRRPSDLRVNTFGSLVSFIARDTSFGVSWNSRYLLEPIGDRRALDTSLQIVFINQHKFKF